VETPSPATIISNLPAVNDSLITPPPLRVHNLQILNHLKTTSTQALAIHANTLVQAGDGKLKFTGICREANNILLSEVMQTRAKTAKITPSAA
jgi:hypothetical protein